MNWPCYHLARQEGVVREVWWGLGESRGGNLQLPGMPPRRNGWRGVRFSPLVLSPPSPPISGAGFPSVPVGKSPMVEQAVQTGSVDNLNAKKLLPGKGPVGMQLSGRPAQPSSKTSSGTRTLRSSGVGFMFSKRHAAAWGSSFCPLSLSFFFLIKKH